MNIRVLEGGGIKRERDDNELSFSQGGGDEQTRREEAKNIYQLCLRQG